MIQEIETAISEVVGSRPAPVHVVLAVFDAEQGKLAVCSTCEDPAIMHTVFSMLAQSEKEGMS